MRRITINALVFQEQGMWIAQCLEYDLVSCAETLEELPGELVRQMRSTVAADLAAGRRPFSGLERPPAEFWTLFEEVKQSTPITPPSEILDGGVRLDVRLFKATKTKAA